MKKKVLTTFLVTVMAITTITGCGKKDEETKASVDNQMSQESTIENDAVESKDWSKAYDEYFKNVEEHIADENTLTIMDGSSSGIEMKVEVATLSDVSYMSMDIGVCSLDMYGYSDKVYIRTNYGDADVWQVAPVSSKEEATALTEGSASTAIIDNNACEFKGYKEETTIDGVVYDVLEASYETEGNLMDVLVYVERDTQKLRKLEGEDEVMGELCVEIKDITEIPLPDEAANAVECTTEDLAGALMAVMFGGMMGDMENGGFELDMDADITFDAEVTDDGDSNINVDASATNNGGPIKITVYN